MNKIEIRISGLVRVLGTRSGVDFCNDYDNVSNLKTENVAIKCRVSYSTF